LHSAKAAVNGFGLHPNNGNPGVRPNYRGDIDGLRAIAVLLVVAFHAFPRKVPGGFIGVDIFFVISGFLITSLIVRGLQTGDFSFTDFYVRRIKRIFPALIAVLAACLLAGWFVLFPGEFSDLSKHAAAGAAFIANFSLLSETGYFDTEADHKPLLHLWSLGIEEQFYIIWPALIVLVWRWKHGPLLMAALICLGSFAWNVYLTPINTAQAFFLPFTRFWELMIGCLIAFAATHESFAAAVPARLAAFYERHRDKLHECAGWTGIALIVLAAALLKPTRAFPGWWALLPTIGTALIIVAGPQSTFNRLVLSHRAMIFIGLISYPLYLWHWPILSFARIIHFKEPTDLVRGLMVALAFLLAYLTYRYIERPIRFGAPTLRKPALAAAAMAAVGGLGLLFWVGHGLPGRFPKEAQALMADVRNDATENVRTYECFYQGQDLISFAAACDGSDQPGARRVMLWGDSHSAHLGPGLNELRKREGFKLARYSLAACPPIMDYVTESQPLCARFNTFVLGRVAELKPDTVILASRWEIFDGKLKFGHVEPQAIKSTIAKLQSLGVKNVIVMGQFPIWVAPVPVLRARNFRLAAVGSSPEGWKDLERNKTYLTTPVYSSDQLIRQAVENTGARFISPLSTLCDDDGCLLVIPNSGGKPIYWDSNHLTRSGSIYFIEKNLPAIIGR
jgi:peptidoglycan/LPS O-acetylase OafA/YrhL